MERAEILTAIAEINEECLALWSGKGLLPIELNSEARRRAATVPCLLVDPAPRLKPESSNLTQCESAARIALHVLMLAWHVVRCRPADSRMLLGLSGQADDLATSTPRKVTRWVEEGRVRVTPRWPVHMNFWRDLCRHAISGDEAALEGARLRGLNLLIAESTGWPRCT